MEGTPEIDPRLLEILVCPLTKARCATIAKRRSYHDEAASPIRSHGIPIMLVDERVRCATTRPQPNVSSP